MATPRKPKFKGNSKREKNYRNEPQGNKSYEEKERRNSNNNKHNDPEWYCSNGQAIKDVASISFNTALGQETYLRSSVISGTYPINVPGIMAIKTIPSIGFGKDMYSPANIAARDVYSEIRKANSGSKNYDPADLMIYLLAMDSIYSFWAWMVRLYGTLRVYSKTNRYVGDLYVMAQGGDPSSLRSNFASFRAYINLFAQSVMALSVPKTMTYFLRHSWMYTNIYKDEDTSKASVYMYVPAGFYQYNPTISAGAGGLSMQNLTCTVDSTYQMITGTLYNSFANIVNYGDTLLRNVLGDEDIAIMSGDILKAYGAENCWKLEYIPEDYAVVPVFSEEVLAQIHNTDFAGRAFLLDQGDGTAAFAGLTAFSVFQDPNVQSGLLYSQPIIHAGYHLLYDKIVDFWKEQPTPEDVIVATRNTLYGSQCTLTPASGSSRLVWLTDAGSEVCLLGEMFKLGAGGVLTSQLCWEADNANPMITGNYDYMRFNEAPTRLVMNSNGVAYQFVGELDTYAMLSGDNIAKMHTCALLSEFGVPYGK